MNNAMKIYPEEHIFKTVEEAVRFMRDTNFQGEVSVYSSDSKKAYEMANQLYPYIKEYNKGKLLKDQILPTNPYGYRGILGCLGVQCYSVGLGTYERNHESVVIFGYYITDVLDTSKETPVIRPGLKALASLGLMAEMMRGGK